MHDGALLGPLLHVGEAYSDPEQTDFSNIEGLAAGISVGG